MIPQTANKLVECPKCKVIGESYWEDTKLQCPECGHEWTFDNHDYIEAVFSNKGEIIWYPKKKAFGKKRS